MLDELRVHVMDRITTINDFALRKARRGTRTGKGAAHAKQAVNIIFLKAMDVSSDELKKLVIEAEASLADVYGLEESLRNIHSHVVTENKELKFAKDEDLRLLWTKLGGNKGGPCIR